MVITFAIRNVGINMKKKKQNKQTGFTLRDILGLDTNDIYAMIVKINKARYQAKLNKENKNDSRT